MACKVSWFHPPYILKVVYAGELTIDEFNQGALDYSTLVVEGQDPVHTIIDVRATKDSKFSMTEVGKAPYTPEAREKMQLGWRIYVGPTSNPFHQFVTAVFAQNLNLKVRWIEDADEALEFLRQQDDRLAEIAFDMSQLALPSEAEYTENP